MIAALQSGCTASTQAQCAAQAQKITVAVTSYLRATAHAPSRNTAPARPAVGHGPSTSTGINDGGGCSLLKISACHLPASPCPFAPTTSGCSDLNLQFNDGTQEGPGNNFNWTSSGACGLDPVLGMVLGCPNAAAAKGSGSSGQQDGSGSGTATSSGDFNPALLARLLELLAQFAREDQAYQAALDAGRVGADAPINHTLAAMTEELGYQEQLAQNALGIQEPSAVTANGPDYVTYNPKTETLTGWDAKWRASGTGYPKTVPESKLSSWMTQIQKAVEAYTGPDAQAVREAFAAGRVNGRIFTYGG